MGLLGEHKAVQLALSLHHVCICLLNLQKFCPIGENHKSHILYACLFIVCKVRFLLLF